MMSNVPYTDLGESSGQQLKNPVSTNFVRRGSEDDKLTEAGDIGVSDKVFASYQVIAA